MRLPFAIQLSLSLSLSLYQAKLIQISPQIFTAFFPFPLSERECTWGSHLRRTRSGAAGGERPTGGAHNELFLENPTASSTTSSTSHAATASNPPEREFPLNVLPPPSSRTDPSLISIAGHSRFRPSVLGSMTRLPL